MRFMIQIGIGLGLAIASSLLVFGALIMASAEGISQQSPTPESTQIIASLEPGIDTPTPQPTSTPVPPTTCPPPKGWVAYTIISGDTLDSIAVAFHVSTQDLSVANCLLSPALFPDTILYVPPPPTLTNTPVPTPVPTHVTSAPSAPQEPSATPVKPTPRVCPNPPAGWVLYTIKQHDTLYSISLNYKVNLVQLQTVNCIADPDSIKYGQKIFVPNTIPAPTRTSAPTNTNKPAPTRTRTSVPPPSSTPVPTHTNTAEPTVTYTSPAAPTTVPSDTPTFTPDVPSTPTDTAVP